MKKFWEMAGTHKCYFVILWMQVQWWRYHDAVGETETIPYRKEFIWTFCSHRWRTHENFGHDHLPLALRMSWRNREIQSYPFILLTILPPTNKVWDKVMFFKVGVCPHGGGGVCIISLPVWLTGLMFLLGVSVSDPMFLLGGSPWGRPPSPARWRVGGYYPTGTLPCISCAQPCITPLTINGISHHEFRPHLCEVWK